MHDYITIDIDLFSADLAKWRKAGGRMVKIDRRLKEQDGYTSMLLSHWRLRADSDGRVNVTRRNLKRICEAIGCGYRQYQSRVDLTKEPGRPRKRGWLAER